MRTVKWFNSFIRSIDVTLAGTTTPSQSGPESNCNEEILHIFQSSRTGTSPLDSLVTYQGLSLGVGSYLLCRDVLGVFDRPSRLRRFWLVNTIVPGYSVATRLISQHEIVIRVNLTLFEKKKKCKIFIYI